MWRRWQVWHKFWIRVVLPPLRLMPYRLAHLLLGLMGRLDLFLVPNQGKLYETAVRESAQRLGCDWDTGAVTRGLSRQTYLWRSRDLLLDRLTDARFDSLFRVSGLENLDGAFAREKGVILLASHFGSHVAISHWLFRHGYPLRWLGERPRLISDYMTRQFQTEGPLGQPGLFLSRKSTMTEGSSAILRAARVLEAGMILKLACDVRRSDAKTATVTFLGRQERFSTSWVNLAAMTGAPVVASFCRTDDSGTCHLEFHEPFTVPATAPRNGQATWWVQRAMNAIEEQVRKHPEHSNDYFFWKPVGDLSLSFSHRGKVAS
jgi:phosphatidylinositol dimannoside acyltransferase